jgi:hypothetical protein
MFSDLEKKIECLIFLFEYKEYTRNQIIYKPNDEV